jgi:hypothetical protein
MREFQECSEESMRSDWKLAKKCEDLMGEIGGLQKKIENRRTESVPQRGQLGANGTNDLNYHSPAPAPDYIPALTGTGSAPVNNPGVIVAVNPDGSQTFTLNGLVEDWASGTDGVFGTADDTLLKVTENSTGTVWTYTNGQISQASKVTNGVTTVLASYAYDTAASTVTVTQADGSSYVYKYTDAQDPFGTGALTHAEYDKDGSHYVQDYDADGRLTTLTKDNVTTTYSYDLTVGLATLTSPTGTRIVDMGADGEHGHDAFYYPGLPGKSPHDPGPYERHHDLVRLRRDPGHGHDELDRREQYQ